MGQSIAIDPNEVRQAGLNNCPQADVDTAIIVGGIGVFIFIPRGWLLPTSRRRTAGPVLNPTLTHRSLLNWRGK